MSVQSCLFVVTIPTVSDMSLVLIGYQYFLWVMIQISRLSEPGYRLGNQNFAHEFLFILCDST